MTKNIMESPDTFALDCVRRSISIASALDQLDGKLGCKGEWRETVVRKMIHYQFTVLGDETMRLPGIMSEAD